NDLVSLVNKIVFWHFRAYPFPPRRGGEGGMGEGARRFGGNLIVGSNGTRPLGTSIPPPRRSPCKAWSCAFQRHKAAGDLNPPTPSFAMQSMVVRVPTAQGRRDPKPTLRALSTP
ncbi:MAG: hypothetical protein KAI66_14670, partial [Lentisphaeria bacterium]|nr:hypothetical protein [Lentisphaeria bacterium]